MDTKLIEDITRAIVDEAIFLNWKFYVLYAFISFLVLCIAAYAFPYLTAKSKNLATKSDFDSLLKQLKENTEATEGIKTAISHNDWELKEYKLLRRTKLEELLFAINEVDSWLENYRNSLLYGDVCNEKSPMFKVEVLSCLYFIDLNDLLKTYKELYATITLSLLQANGELINLKQDQLAIDHALSSPQNQLVITNLIERQKKLNEMKISIIQKASNEHVELLKAFKKIKLEIELGAAEIMTKITNAKVVANE